MKTKLLSLLILFVAQFFSAQAANVLYYQFNGTPWNNPTINNAPPPNPSQDLKYYSSGNTSINPVANQRIETADEGSYLELVFNTTNLTDLTVEWYGGVVNTFFGSGQWTLQQYIGSSWVTIGLPQSYNILNGRTYSINLDPAANNTTGVRIRIVASEINSFLLNTHLVLDNLLITSKSPKINLFGYNTSNNTEQIPENAPAATMLGTDFGIVVTDDANNPNSKSRTFRISNTGTANLVVSDITITGTAAADFSLYPVANPPTSPAPIPAPTNPFTSVPTTIAPNSFKEFVIKFNPTQDGKRIALVNVFSNASPSPFSYYVEGRGATCASVDLVLKRNTMETSQNSSEILNATPEGSSNFRKVSGNSRAETGQTNTLGTGNGTKLYPHDNRTSRNYPLFTSTNTSWYTRDETSTVNFGPVDVTNEKGVYITFNLAAFATATSRSFNDNDYVALEVLKPGTTNDWSQELRIVGGGGSNGNENQSRYSFGIGTTATATYDGDENPIIFTNATAQTAKYSKAVLKIEGSSNFQQLIFRIVAFNNNDEKLWLIDDVAVYSANSIYKKWTASGWRDVNNSATTAPVKNIKAIIDANYNTTNDGNINACECEVNAGKNVVVTSTGLVTLQNKLVNNGTFTIQSDGNLIQVENDADNSGNIVVERSVTDMDNVLATQMDYVYWSSPVAGQGLQAFSPGTPINRIYQYNEWNDYFSPVNLATEPNFIPGKGYAIRAEDGYANGYNKTYTFTGEPNNGEILRTIHRSPNTGAGGTVVHGYNLVGNPYPSNIKFDELYAGNTKSGVSLIWNTAYFWTNNNYQMVMNGSNYSGNNYAVYNGTGGNSATGPHAASGTGLTVVPNGIVKVGQSFIVQKKDLGSAPLRFSNTYGANSLRVSTAGTFFHRNEVQKDRYWLKLIAPDSLVNSQLIGYIPGATNGFEKDFDAEAFSLSSDLFYSKLEDKDLLIQGRGTFVDTDKVILGANFFRNGSYTIELENPEGIFGDSQAIYLKDNELGTYTNLQEGGYQFMATAGMSEGRFEIVYVPETVLSTGNTNTTQLLVYRDGGDFVVRSAEKNISEIEVYDASGRLILKKAAKNREVRISAETMVSGMYVLKTTLENGEVYNRKIRK